MRNQSVWNEDIDIWEPRIHRIFNSDNRRLHAHFNRSILLSNQSKFGSPWPTTRVTGYVNQLKWTKLEKALKLNAAQTEESQKQLESLILFERTVYERREAGLHYPTPEDRDARDVAPAHK